MSIAAMNALSISILCELCHQLNQSYAMATSTEIDRIDVIHLFKNASHYAIMFKKGLLLFPISKQT